MANCSNINEVPRPARFLCWPSAQCPVSLASDALDSVEVRILYGNRSRQLGKGQATL